MEIVVYDTNVIIDLHKVGLLTAVAHSGWNIHTTQLVMGELQCPQRDEVKTMLPSLQIHDYNTPESYKHILEYLNNIAHRGNLSMTDASVLLLAKELNAILSTNDMKLRKIAIADGVRINGTIGIILLLLEQRLIVPEQATNAIHLLGNNPRFSEELLQKAMDKVEQIKQIQEALQDGEEGY